MHQLSPRKTTRDTAPNAIARHLKRERVTNGERLIQAGHDNVTAELGRMATPPTIRPNHSRPSVTRGFSTRQSLSMMLEDCFFRSPSDERTPFEESGIAGGASEPEAAACTRAIKSGVPGTPRMFGVLLLKTVDGLCPGGGPGGQHWRIERCAAAVIVKEAWRAESKIQADQENIFIGG